MVAGNVVEDRAPGGWQPGGPSLYSARMCASLGADVTLVTTLSTGYPAEALDGLALRTLPATVAPRYANTYDHAGQRTQLLLEEGTPIPAAFVQQAAEGADALMIAPAFHEFSGPPPMPPAVLAVALQGLLRTRDAEHRVSPHLDAWGQVARFAVPGAFLFLSEEDAHEPAVLAREAAAASAHVLLTRGAEGALYFPPGRDPVALAALPATLVEPTGAGDCFAAAFVVRLLETGDIPEACRWALAAGALAVQAPGLAGIPTRAMVEAHLRREAA